ncbi:MAG: hypothetical protein M3430_07120 [Acidobacteriota bacterium]|nr:hypothetical protein [Acidobacteriota bacterium]
MFTKSRVVLAAFLLPATLFLSSCSYSTNFVIVNKSKSPVEVQYILNYVQRNDPSSRLSMYDMPTKKALEDLEDYDVAWRDLRYDEYRYDESTRTVTVTLPPDEVLRVARTFNYSGHSSERDGFFRIEEIRITGANGSVCYEGKQAQYQFIEQDMNLYTMTYFGWGDKSNATGN